MSIGTYVLEIKGHKTPDYFIKVNVGIDITIA